MIEVGLIFLLVCTFASFVACFAVLLLYDKLVLKEQRHNMRTYVDRHCDTMSDNFVELKRIIRRRRIAIASLPEKEETPKNKLYDFINPNVPPENRTRNPDKGNLEKIYNELNSGY